MKRSLIFSLLLTLVLGTSMLEAMDLGAGDDGFDQDEISRAIAASMDRSEDKDKKRKKPNDVENKDEDKTDEEDDNPRAAKRARKDNADESSNGAGETKDVAAGTVDSKQYEVNLSGILQRFRLEIGSKEKQDLLTDAEIAVLFSNLAEDKNASKIINEMIRHFAARITTKTVNAQSRVYRTRKHSIYPANADSKSPFLSACACDEFTLAERLLITFKQVNAIIEEHLDRTKRIVHASLASGGADEETGCELLQLFMLVKALLEFGYQDIVVIPIDPKATWHPSMNCSFFKTLLGQACSIKTTVTICTFFDSFPKTISSNCPSVTIKPYESPAKAINDKACPLYHSVDVIDFDIWQQKHDLREYVHTCPNETPVIFEGRNHTITKLFLKDIPKPNPLHGFI